MAISYSLSKKRMTFGRESRRAFCYSVTPVLKMEMER